MYGNGNLTVIHTLDICHNDHRLELKRQVIETVLERVFEFVSFGFLIRGHVRVRQPARRVHFLPIFSIGLQRRGWAALLAAQFVVTGIRYGAHQPRLERPAPEGGNAFKRRNERFLGGICGEVFIAENAERGIVNAILIVQDERVEGVETASLRVVDKGLFVHRKRFYHYIQMGIARKPILKRSTRPGIDRIDFKINNAYTILIVPMARHVLFKSENL